MQEQKGELLHNSLFTGASWSYSAVKEGTTRQIE